MQLSRRSFIVIVLWDTMKHHLAAVSCSSYCQVKRIRIKDDQYICIRIRSAYVRCVNCSVAWWGAGRILSINQEKCARRAVIAAASLLHMVVFMVLAGVFSQPWGRSCVLVCWWSLEWLWACQKGGWWTESVPGGCRHSGGLRSRRRRRLE